MLKRKQQPNQQTIHKPLRLWPGVVIVLVQYFARFIVPIFAPDALYFGVMIGVFGGGLALVIWWVFLSRAPLHDRWSAIALMIIGLLATPLILHESVATAAMGMLFIILAIPVLSLAFVAWAFISRQLSDGPRRLTMAATILLACGGFSFVQVGGITNEADTDFAWRWSETPEERLLIQTSNEQMALPSSNELIDTKAEWPGFLGPNRDGVIQGVKIETDWNSLPPVEMWRRQIGPGWSSFAVHGNLFYTQEQRGDNEVVACYKVSTGEPVWKYSNDARFWEANGGAGPRGTPTLRNGRVYSFGGTGILNVLNAGDGSIIWSRNAVSDTEAKLPYWGFSSSPLVVDDIVLVAASGALAAYDLATGDPRWFGPVGGESYSSPHLLTIDGVKQILTLSGTGLTSVAPDDGTLLWEYAWPGFPIVQPVLTADGDILVSVGQNKGIRRISVAHGPGGWDVQERWSSKGLKPYYSEFYVHNGFAFGFDGSILACIDVTNGKRTWKGGRYGAGQLILLADQDLLLVLSEQGELALVAAVSDKFKELARFPAIESKTWNHPVLVDNVLLTRNAQEMAAFQLSLVDN